MTTGERLRRIRLMRGLTRAELGSILSISPVTVERIECDLRRGDPRRWRETAKWKLELREKVKLWAAMNTPTVLTPTSNYRINQERKKWLNVPSETPSAGQKSRKSSLRKSKNG